MKRIICWIRGHLWRSEKEFYSCGRCHKAIHASEYRP